MTAAEEQRGAGSGAGGTKVLGILSPTRSHPVVLVALKSGGAGAPARSGEGRVRAELVPPQLRLCREVRGEWDRRTQREGEGTQREWGQRPRESRRDGVMRWGMGLGLGDPS